MLIVARALQGVGAALMTPQTMSMITRVFPPQKRGAAMGLWGAVAGIATITGPVLGGLLVQTVGWEWIFYVNIPVGVVALVLALRDRSPPLPTANRSFDGLGVLLSVVGMFLVVFGLQEGATYDWGTITGPITVWGVIGAGVLVLVGFVLWQRHRGSDALLPLTLFHSRNFSLSNVAGGAVTFAMIGIFFPFTLFLQEVLGLSPLNAALVGLPGSLLSGVVAPFAGRLSDKVAGKWVVASGFAILSVAITWLALAVQPDAPVWHLVLPMTLFGIGTGALVLAAGQPGHVGSRRPHRGRRRGGVQHDPADRRRHRLRRDRRDADLAARGHHPGGRRGCRRPGARAVPAVVRRRVRVGELRQRRGPAAAVVGAGGRRRADRAGRAAGGALRVRHRGDADDAAHGRGAGAGARLQPGDEGRPPGAPRAGAAAAKVAAEV